MQNDATHKAMAAEGHPPRRPVSHDWREYDVNTIHPTAGQDDLVAEADEREAALPARIAWLEDYQETRWRLTPEGASVVAGIRTQEDLNDATVEAAVRMEDAYSLAERLAQRDEWGG